MVPCLSVMSGIICLSLIQLLHQPTPSSSAVMTSQRIASFKRSSPHIKTDTHVKDLPPSLWKRVLFARRESTMYDYDNGANQMLNSVLDTCAGSGRGSKNSLCDYNGNGPADSSVVAAARWVSSEDQLVDAVMKVIEVCEACGQFWASLIGLNYCCRCNDKVFEFCVQAVHGDTSNYIY